MQIIEFFKHPTNRSLNGLIFGLLAIIGFSATLPATRLAVSAIDPALVGPGRALVAAIPSLLLLLWLKTPLPTRKQWPDIAIVSLSVVIGFPWLTSIAMQNVSGAQAGIIVSILPLFTAIAGALLLKQRPSAGFWLMSLLGSALVIIYLLWSRQGQLQRSELILLGASVICAMGYAVGGRLARKIGGVSVICQALVLSMPFSLAWVIYTWAKTDINELAAVPWQAWSGFIYISLISQWLAFMLWYRGLALGGVVRVSQIQLVQPFLTLFISAFLLDETITALMAVFAGAVVISVAIGRRMHIETA